LKHGFVSIIQNENTKTRFGLQKFAKDIALHKGPSVLSIKNVMYVIFLTIPCPTLRLLFLKANLLMRNFTRKLLQTSTNEGEYSAKLSEVEKSRCPCYFIVFKKVIDLCPSLPSTMFLPD
jgi:hypothetical protein